MRIYTKAGDLAFSTMTFSDSQPHFKLETYEREFNLVTVELAIRSSADLFMLLLVSSVLRQHGYSEINVDIRYLLGARMDRAISSMEPFTLEIVARIINSCGFNHVRILDVHSEAATRLIRNSENILPRNVVKQVLGVTNATPVCPDKGATERVRALSNGMSIIYCSKVRDTATGALSSFKVDVCEGAGRCYTPFEALIIDDICDGGGTFIGLSKELRAKGAKKVNLFVTHGIFSKGLPLEGIDKVFTTNSYYSGTFEIKNSLHRPFENSSSISHEAAGLVVVPISMKEL